MLLAKHITYANSLGLVKTPEESWENYRNAVVANVFPDDPVLATQMYFNVEEPQGLEKHHKMFLAAADMAQAENGIGGLKEYLKDYASKN